MNSYVARFTRLSPATLAFVLLTVLGVPVTNAQRTVVPLPPNETFTEADRPTVYWDGEHSWEEPWGYRRPGNAGRVYPLMVFGPMGGTEYFTEAIRKTYPAFYYGFYKASEADGAALSDTIDAVMASRGFRIDLNRIYLSGFSAGGSGSYKTIRGFLSKGRCFAGLIRIAGQSESVLAEGAVNKIAISMHVGLQDDSKRINVSRALYAYIRDHPANARAVETVLQTEFTPPSDKFPGITKGTITTKVLALDGVDVIRYSEYDPMDHDNEIPFTVDPALYSWIMTRTIGTTPNHAPVLTPVGSRSTPAGQQIQFTVQGTDADGDTLQYSATGSQ